jgi:hypothetical protein
LGEQMEKKLPNAMVLAMPLVLVIHLPSQNWTESG